MGRQHDVTDSLAGKTGEDFVIAMRALALLASAQDGTVVCSGCGHPALYIGMQRCGAPGGPVCQGCLDLHFEWIRSWEGVSDTIPMCRHCGQDVDRDHIYAVDLFDGAAGEFHP